MSLIIEDGTGKSDSDAYIDLDYAKSYFDKMNYDYTCYEDPAIERSILMATEYIDFRFPYRGRKYKDDQALAWPRYICEAVLPEKIKKACAEYAFLSLKDELIINDCSDSNIKKKMKQAGKVKIETEYHSQITMSNFKTHFRPDTMLKQYRRTGPLRV